MRAAVVLAASAALFAAACAHEAPKPPPPPARVVEAPPPAPEKNDGIEVAGTLGRLSEEEIGGPFQRRWDEITRCYQEASAKIDYLAGRIELKLRIDDKGDPKSAFVVGSTFGNWDAERCVLTVARALHFAKPHGGPEAEFTYPIEFRGRRAVTNWDGGRVEPSLARHKRDLAACKLKVRAAELPPALHLTVYVVPGGKVTSVGLAADGQLDDAFGACLVQKMRLWRLDDPLGQIAKATVDVAQ
jgi:hypothetical protein